MGNVRMRAEQINYGASNVKAALDDLDPMELIALSERMDTIEAWKATVKTEEKTGADVTFTNALALAAVSLSAEIEAEQDLHGQSAPYVGGGGKNKLPMTVSAIKAANTGGTWSGNTYTYRGVTWTIQTDNADNVTGIKANGTSTGLCSFKIAEFTGLSDIILNGCPSGGSGTNYNQQLYDETSSTWGSSDYGSGVTVNNLDTTHTYSVWVVVRSDITASNLLFNPMIRLATETDPTFAPYSNISPISGHTSVTITDVDAESNTATVTVQLGQTVYGGTLNVTTGVLTVDRVKVSKTWGQMVNATDLGSGVTRKLCNKGSIGTLLPMSAESISNVCAYFGGGWNDPVIRWFHDETNAFFYLPSDTPSDLVCEWLAPLATPTTIQLTPEQLTMLKGYNRLSADTGDITVEAYTGAAWGGDEV